MIEINLVPEHLRKKKKRSFLGPHMALPKEMILGFVIGLVVFLMVVHALLQGVIFVRYAQHKNYERQKDLISSEKANVDRIVQDLRRLQGNAKAFEKIGDQRNIQWSRILNDISDSVPRGVWLTRIILDKNVLRIQGSAVSKSKAEIINVHAFTSQLKENGDFMQHVKSVEPGLIKSRQIVTTPVADFTVTIELK